MPSSLRVHSAPLAALTIRADGHTSYVATKQGAVLCAVGEGAYVYIVLVCKLCLISDPHVDP